MFPRNLNFVPTWYSYITDRANLFQARYSTAELTAAGLVGYLYPVSGAPILPLDVRPRLVRVAATNGGYKWLKAPSTGSPPWYPLGTLFYIGGAQYQVVDFIPEFVPPWLPTV